MQISTPLSSEGQLEFFAAAARPGLPAIVLLSEMRAAEAEQARDVAEGLASSGYAVLLISLQALQSRPFGRLLDELAGLELIDTQRLALMGLGSGAEQALQLAVEHACIRAVVAVAPGGGALLPLERITGPILLLAGMEDTRWPAVEIADQLIERLATQHFAHGVSLHSYGDAGHWLFGPPLPRNHPAALRLSDTGGSLEGNLRARRDSWRKTLEFLEDCIGIGTEERRSVLVYDENWIGPRR